MNAEVVAPPPEAMVKTSMLLVFAGFALLVSVVILAILSWASRGASGDDEPDIFGKFVKVRDVFNLYKAPWSPGKFWPPDVHEHMAQKNRGSPLFKIIWYFLVGWFVCAAFFLIFAGAIDTIEVFREESHLRAAGCVAAAWCLCAIWPIVFRTGWTQGNVNKGGSAPTITAQTDASTEAVANVDPPKDRGVFLWLAFALLLVAATFAVAGSATLQAWTLPGPQHGTLIFLGPGYGLFAGWVLFAAALNLSTAISYSSYPSGVPPFPVNENQFTHRPSLWPPVLAIIIANIAVLAMDPAIPVPMLISILLFTPRNTTHFVTSGVLVLGIVVASLFVVANRAS